MYAQFDDIRGYPAIRHGGRRGVCKTMDSLDAVDVAPFETSGLGLTDRRQPTSVVDLVPKTHAPNQT